MLAGFGLTLCTGDSRGSTVSSSGAVDVRVSATLLDGHLIADAVSSAQNHLSGVWRTWPVPGFLCTRENGPFTRQISWDFLHSLLAQFQSCLLNRLSSHLYDTLVLPFPYTLLFWVCLLCEFLPITLLLTFPLDFIFGLLEVDLCGACNYLRPQ